MKKLDLNLSRMSEHESGLTNTTKQMDDLEQRVAEIEARLMILDSHLEAKVRELGRTQMLCDHNFAAVKRAVSHLCTDDDD